MRLFDTDRPVIIPYYTHNDFYKKLYKKYLIKINQFNLFSSKYRLAADLAVT